jgi:hypothetical protein
LGVNPLRLLGRLMPINSTAVLYGVEVNASFRVNGRHGDPCCQVKGQMRLAHLRQINIG